MICPLQPTWMTEISFVFTFLVYQKYTSHCFPGTGFKWWLFSSLFVLLGLEESKE